MFWQLWPGKFQNKTNGVTPRRWIRFCNPDLSKIITDWIGTEDWILDMEKLSELRKVIAISILLACKFIVNHTDSMLKTTYSRRPFICARRFCLIF